MERLAKFILYAILCFTAFFFVTTTIIVLRLMETNLSEAYALIILGGFFYILVLIIMLDELERVLPSRSEENP